MEEEDTRRFQRNKGRFGVTLRYNADEAATRRKEPDSIILVGDYEHDYGGRRAVGISLNARKNWELFEGDPWK